MIGIDSFINHNNHIKSYRIHGIINRHDYQFKKNKCMCTNDFTLQYKGIIIGKYCLFEI